VSLYGTGRREGIVAALCITALVLAVHLGTALLVPAASGADLGLALRRGALPALGGVLCYRFLRAQGRSRYAGFLCGAAYGLSPWLGALGDAPREQLAAALAPLALELANRCDRPSQRRVWLPWAWLFLAAPFVAGVTVVGTLAAVLCAGAFLRIILCGDQDAELPKLRGLLLASIGAAAAATNLVWLDPLGAWLGEPTVLGVRSVLTGHRGAGADPDLAAALRVPGALLLCFAGLALLRRQRHVDGLIWSGLVLLGSLPTWFEIVPWLARLAPHWTAVAMLAVCAWWLSLLGASVLAAAGLDDFLDLPQRRRTALPWLLAIAVLAAPLLAAFGADAPAREWPLTMTWLLLALLLPLWRRLGILRFKNVLGVAALVMLAMPTLQSQPARSPWSAAPLGEVMVTDGRENPYEHWHWQALGTALALTGAWSVVAWRSRRREAIASVQFRGAALKQKRAARSAP
jgi:hypothetical protein